MGMGIEREIVPVWKVSARYDTIEGAKDLSSVSVRTFAHGKAISVICTNTNDTTNCCSRQHKHSRSNKMDAFIANVHANNIDHIVDWFR